MHEIWVYAERKVDAKSDQESGSEQEPVCTKVKQIVTDVMLLLGK